MSLRYVAMYSSSNARPFPDILVHLRNCRAVLMLSIFIWRILLIWFCQNQETLQNLIFFLRDSKICMNPDKDTYIIRYLQTRPEVSEVDPQRWLIGRDIRDWQTYKKYRIICKWSRNATVMFSKISEICLIQKWRYLYIDMISVKK